MYMELKDAVKKYGEGEAAVYALNHASFEMEKGEVCVILGPSGSGKSTLLNMLGGLDHLDEGTLEIDGCRLDRMSKAELTRYRRSKVGFVFQAYNLIAELTVRENIRVVEDISKDPLDMDKLIEDLGLKALKDHFPAEMSGGQQQRCAIGRALIKNPSILLCDELTGALDSKSAMDVLKVLSSINEKYKTTIVIITHNEAIAGMADRIVRIHDGNVIKNELNVRQNVEELAI